MIRAAVVGIGWWGRHVIRHTAGSEVIKPVLAVDPNPAAAAFASEHGLNYAPSVTDALHDAGIDAVILCTPHSLHAGQTLAAAEAGKHVFCEKPLALTRADAEKSVAACRQAGLVLGIGHERRYEPAVKEVRRLLREGALGTIMHAEANFSHDKLADVPEGDWRTSPKDAPAAGMTAMGIHLTDLLIDLIGPVSEVFAATSSRVAYKDNGDVLSVHLRFFSGPTAYVNAILVTPHYIRLTIFGSDAWVEVRNHTHPDTPGPVDLILQRKDRQQETRTYQWTDTVRENLELFARAIEGKAEYIFTDAQKIANIATLEAICRSVAENLPIAIAPVPGN
jgi:predicted dehydrogenase